MSTTVIASRHGLTLSVLPAAGPSLDVAAVREVLQRHGVRLIEGSDLQTSHEFIAAEGLDPAASAALAEDLRTIGLSVRVVNQTGLTRSRRVGQAIATQLFVGMAGLSAVMMSLIPIVDAVKDGAGMGSPWMALPVGLGALAMAWAGFNTVVLQRQSGNGLRVAGKTRTAGDEPAQLTDQLADLLSGLPAHVSDGLLEQARALEVHARQDPNGAAAQELAALVEDLRGEADAEAVQAVTTLREEVARARRAMHEAQKSRLK